MKFGIFFGILLICHANFMESYKILGIFPTMGRSHYITGGALMKGLAAAGHDITVISPFPQDKPVKNFRDISTDGMISLMSSKLSNIKFNKK